MGEKQAVTFALFSYIFEFSKGHFNLKCNDHDKNHDPIYHDSDNGNSGKSSKRVNVTAGLTLPSHPLL